MKYLSFIVCVALLTSSCTFVGVPVHISPSIGGKKDARPWAGNNLSVFCKYHPEFPECWGE